MTVYLAINLGALYVTAGALIGLPAGYALGWLCDPSGLPMLLGGVFRSMWSMGGQVAYLMTYTMAMEVERS